VQYYCIAYVAVLNILHILIMLFCILIASNYLNSTLSQKTTLLWLAITSNDFDNCWHKCS